MIYEGSCDTEDWSNYAENLALTSHELIAMKTNEWMNAVGIELLV